MNKTILMGRLTKNPEVKYLQDENSTAMARYTLAVDRRYRKDGKAETDFISCVTFGKNAEFAEKYLKKGLKILVSGRIQTGSYVNQEGNKVYATNVIVEEHYFAEGKKLSGSLIWQSMIRRRQRIKYPIPICTSWFPSALYRKMVPGDKNKKRFQY